MDLREFIVDLEKKWVKVWNKQNPAYCNLDTKKKKKFYSLGMFVYPSGDGLHAGHPKNYFPLDAISRYKKMNGYEVLNPMGFDAFGLPAEQYARKTGKDPKKNVEDCIEKFKFQFQRLGMFIDWSKEINTTDPEYFKTTQWIFLRLLKLQYTYKEMEAINWCEELGTVLANEETKFVDGKLVSDIGEFPVTKKSEMQWVMDVKRDGRLLLDNLDDKSIMNWPEEIIKQQKNWIGEIPFYYGNIVIDDQTRRIFSLEKLVPNQEYNLYISIKSSLYKSLKKKNFPTSTIEIDDERGTVHQINYKVGEVRFTFRKHTGIIRIYVLNRTYVLGNLMTLALELEKCNEQIHNFMLAGRELDHLYPKLQESVNDINDDKPTGYVYRLRNWVFSRQRYWGEPIPVLFSKWNELEPLSLNELPLELPKVTSYNPLPGSKTVLEDQKEWLEILKGEDTFKREVFTMPQWAGSSWYYLAYLMKDGNGYLDITSDKARKRFEKWLPVDLYIGGKEHSVLHLIYARFWHHVLWINFKTGDPLLKQVVDYPEPFYQLVNQGMVLDENNKKMSKSKGNIIDPVELADKYGADAFRLFILFAGPIEDSIQLSEKGIKSMGDWLARVWRLFDSVDEDSPSKEMEKEYNILIYKITKALDNLKMNTAISYMMEFVNVCHKQNKGKIFKAHCKGFLQVLHCFAPFVSQELFVNIERRTITDTAWPKFNKKYLEENSVTYAIQINGKLRATLEVDKNTEKNDVLKQAKNVKKIKLLLKDKRIRKEIFVQSKIVNLVVV